MTEILSRASVKIVQPESEKGDLHSDWWIRVRHETFGGVNLGKVTMEAFYLLKDLDRCLVGSPSYMGVAWFWGNHGYKHILRAATPRERKLVHKEWIEKGLDLWEDSDLHDEIVYKHCQTTIGQL